MRLKGSSYPSEVVELCAKRANVVGGMVGVIGAHESVLILSVGAHVVLQVSQISTETFLVFGLRNSQAK